MRISIDRFEEEVHVLILERGKEYFDANQVLMLQQTTQGWTAVIEGTEAYQVLLEGHDEFTQWHCTCPFDRGPVCKHVAAVFYAVREAIAINRAHAGGDLHRWVDDAPVDELRSLLRRLLRTHEGVQEEIYKWKQEH